MNPDTTAMSHERFGELSALAAIGRIPEADYAEWQVHLVECSSCRSEYASFRDLALNELPLIQPLAPPVRQAQAFSSDLDSAQPEGAATHERFLARARAEGFQLSDMPAPRNGLWDRFRSLLRPSPAYGYALASLALLAAVLLMGYRLRQITELSQSQSEEIARLKEQVSALPRETQSRIPQTEITSASDAKGGSTTSDLQDQLTQSRADAAKLVARSNALDQELANARSEVQTLRNELTSKDAAQADVLQRLQQAEQNLAQFGDQLQTLRSQHAQDTQTVSQQKAQLDEVAQRLSAQEEAIDRDRRLLAADRDIRDLMGARNLRIVEVLDVDGRGKTKRPFGRAFYTEGKSLIFYAFDLGDKRLSPTDASFQAWGYHEPDRVSVQSLGILYEDDQKANRWILKFENPDVLADIDSVFVTIEPPGGSKKPSGKRLLYAYLNVKPNHP
jgi:hypothetical protein